MAEEDSFSAAPLQQMSPPDGGLASVLVVSLSTTPQPSCAKAVAHAEAPMHGGTAALAEAALLEDRPSSDAGAAENIATASSFSPAIVCSAAALRRSASVPSSWPRSTSREVCLTDDLARVRRPRRRKHTTNNFSTPALVTGRLGESFSSSADCQQQEVAGSAWRARCSSTPAAPGWRALGDPREAPSP